MHKTVVWERSQRHQILNTWFIVRIAESILDPLLTKLTWNLLVTSRPETTLVLRTHWSIYVFAFIV